MCSPTRRTPRPDALCWCTHVDAGRHAHVHVVTMAALDGFRIDTSDALRTPSREQFKRRVGRLSPGLWKIGSSYLDLIDVRSRDAAHYDSEYFDRDRAVCLAYDLDDTERAAVLETTAIQHAKFQLRIGVNDKSCDDVPHDGYSPERPGALYAVPVLPYIKTQQQFKETHASYYMQRTHGSEYADKPRTLRAKRALLLDKLIAAIPRYSSFSARSRARRAPGFSGRCSASTTSRSPTPRRST